MPPPAAARMDTPRRQAPDCARVRMGRERRACIHAAHEILGFPPPPPSPPPPDYRFAPPPLPPDLYATTPKLRKSLFEPLASESDRRSGLLAGRRIALVMSDSRDPWPPSSLRPRIDQMAKWVAPPLHSVPVAPTHRPPN